MTDPDRDRGRRGGGEGSDDGGPRGGGSDGGESDGGRRGGGSDGGGSDDREGSRSDDREGSDDALRAAVGEFLTEADRVFEEYDAGYVDADAAMRRLDAGIEELRRVADDGEDGD